DRALNVELRRDGAMLDARVEGREYRLNVLEAQAGVYSFIQSEEGGTSTEAVVQEKEGLFHVRVRNRSFEATVERPGIASAPDGPGRSGDGPSVLKAIMPGRVVRVLVEKGTSVKRGEGIVVLEAMKMENQIGSPRDGKVTKIHVSAGDRVEGGAALAVIE
ncbi:MAG TPA: biotin/lipoyl-containing protein, partial [Candidatus Saccharimonadales bacterium]|nr:biotin/lipoyl-containing protein [Candidatus Saccharimonadales bacterium]